MGKFSFPLVTVLTGFHCRLLVSIYNPWWSKLLFELSAVFKVITQGLWEGFLIWGPFHLVLCHYTINICTVSKCFYFFFWTADNKIPEDKTWGGYYPQAYSRMMIFFFSIQDQVNTCVLMQWSNQNLTWFLQGNPPGASLQGTQVIKFYSRKRIKMYHFLFPFLINALLLKDPK